jgi:hypothetical protein
MSFAVINIRYAFLSSGHGMTDKDYEDIDPKRSHYANHGKL